MKLHPFPLSLLLHPHVVAAKSLINSSIPPNVSAGLNYLQCYHMQQCLDSLRLFVKRLKNLTECSSFVTIRKQIYVIMF